MCWAEYRADLYKMDSVETWNAPLVCKHLITKLTHFNFSEKSLKWMESYLSSRFQCVRVQNTKSMPCENNLGVPQGSILGPLSLSLFLMTWHVAVHQQRPAACMRTMPCFMDTTDKAQAAEQLTAVMSDGCNWLESSHLHLNVSRTVSKDFSTRLNKSDTDPHICVREEKLEVVQEFKYRGVVLDSQLSFKQHTQKTVNKMKLNLSNFRCIRNNLTFEAARLYFDAVIMSHMSYCITSWASAGETTLRSLESTYKQARTVLDRTHEMNLSDLKELELLDMETTVKYTDSILVSILHGLAPAPLQDYIKRNISSTTRAGSRGNRSGPLRRSALGRAMCSSRATDTWSSAPSAIRHLSTLTSLPSGRSSLLSRTGIISNVSADLLLSILSIVMFYCDLSRCIYYVYYNVLLFGFIAFFIF